MLKQVPSNSWFINYIFFPGGVCSFRFLFAVILVQANQDFTVTESRSVYSLGAMKGRVNPIARHKLKLDKVSLCALIWERTGVKGGGEVTHITNKFSIIYTVGGQNMIISVPRFFSAKGSVHKNSFLSNFAKVKCHYYKRFTEDKMIERKSKITDLSETTANISISHC